MILCLNIDSGCASFLDLSAVRMGMNQLMNYFVTNFGQFIVCELKFVAGQSA